MYKKKTVFIVGAGASVEFNFPLGAQLKTTIAEIVNVQFDGFFGESTRGDGVVASAMRKHAGASEDALEALVKASRQIVDAMPGARSIDNFLHSRDGDAEINLVGKLGIARAILAAERKSSLYVTTPRERLSREQHRYGLSHLDGLADEFNPLSESWLAKFAMQLCQEFHHRSLETLFDNVSFIIFNYDRCIEHYLWHFLQKYFAISEDESARLLSNARFHHPYGAVGRLPWQRDDGPMMRFGAEPTDDGLLSVIGGIKTFTESVHTDDQQRLTEDLQLAERVVFLGFGFIEQNMRLLEVEQINRVGCPVFATAFGMSVDSCLVIGNSITKAFHFKQGFHPTQRGLIEIHERMKAAELFDYYQLRLG